MNKLKSRNIVFLGTRHKQQPILKFLANIISKLSDFGVTHFGLEIASDQQVKIGRFMKTGNGLSDIEIPPQIDCREYRNLFNIIRSLDPDKRQKPVALDLPKSKYGGKIGRDEWMVKSIASVFKTNPNAKMLIVVENNHIPKKSESKDRAVKKRGSIRPHLSQNRRMLRMASIGQLIGETVYEDDCRRKFGHIHGAVAVDLDERFAGWRLGIAESVAIKAAEVSELLDGVVVY